MKSFIFVVAFIFAALTCKPFFTLAVAAQSDLGQNVAVSMQWNGDFPVAKLSLLPAQQQTSATGFIGDAPLFALI